ncbi:MAG: SurA N-terminal domain-containing protein [Bacteroidales bacterium]|nr:SurA N-terminal domain-containing protein [Bacteroidales bacterium]
MLAKIVYIIGVVLAIWCVLDIFKHNKLSLLMKILLSIAVLAFSWLGFAVYYFLIRNKI